VHRQICKSILKYIKR